MQKYLVISGAYTAFQIPVSRTAATIVEFFVSAEIRSSLDVLTRVLLSLPLGRLNAVKGYGSWSRRLAKGDESVKLTRYGRFGRQAPSAPRSRGTFLLPLFMKRYLTAVTPVVECPYIVDPGEERIGANHSMKFWLGRTAVSELVTWGELVSL